MEGKCGTKPRCARCNDPLAVGYNINTFFNSYLISGLTESVSEGVEDDSEDCGKQTEMTGNVELYPLKTQRNNYMKQTVLEYFCRQNSNNLVP